MAPLTPTWKQPSHPDVQEVIINEAEFTTKSISRTTLPPFGLFAKFAFPPCTEAPEPTYATVQMGRNRHLNLNSDLLYINHSCEPSLIFDIGNMNVMAGPKGLKPGDELTFFYPSTEWEMAQPFQCLCGTPSCRGTIDGARNMTAAQLDGMWLTNHIRELLDEQARGLLSAEATDATSRALEDALQQAEKTVEAARSALHAYVAVATGLNGLQNGSAKAGKIATNGSSANGNARDRRGPTSRELSGEMGGDTAIRA